MQDLAAMRVMPTHPGVHDIYIYIFLYEMLKEIDQQGNYSSDNHATVAHSTMVPGLMSMCVDPQRGSHREWMSYILPTTNAGVPMPLNAPS